MKDTKNKFIVDVKNYTEKAGEIVSTVTGFKREELSKILIQQ
ncbi:hypothetical protein [Lysinibacillus sp. NPDC059133]